jgi:hypothetical protein
MHAITRSDLAGGHAGLSVRRRVLAWKGKVVPGYMIAGYAARLGTRVAWFVLAAVAIVKICTLPEYLEILQLESGFEKNTRD